MGSKLNDLYVGNKKIKEVWVGNKLVWQRPSDWPGLKLTSQQDNSTIGYTISGTVNKDIYTSTDSKTWTPWDGSNITLNNGESIYVWNKTNTLSTSTENYLTFTMSGRISASGNVNSMVNFSELTPYCYCGMFSGCISLTTSPDLPAITLAEGCYYAMFNYCDHLTTVPDLPAITLVENCYYAMFQSCIRLNSIKLSYTGNFSSTYFGYWVNGVSATGDFYYNGSDTTVGNSAIPTGWTIHTFIP